MAQYRIQYRWPFMTYATILLALQPLPVFSQNATIAQLAPAQVNPGLLMTTPGEMSNRNRPGAAENLPALPDEEIKLDVPAPQAQVPQSSPAFLVRKIVIRGITLLKEDEAQKMVAPYEGQPQTLENLDRLVAKITAFYREQGYLTTEAFLPPQEVKDGVLIIQVQEGSVGTISMEGNRFYRVRVIGRNLRQKPGERLNFRVLEKDLNQINRFADGYKVKAFLSAGDKPGESNIKLKVAERQPFQISPTFDNQGRYFVGLYRLGVEARDDSLFRSGDRLYARWIGAEGTRVAIGSYSVPLNRFGTELGGTFAYSHVNVKLPIENPPEITGNSYNAGISLTQPLGRKRQWQLDGGFNWQRVNNFFEGEQTNSDEVHSLQLGLNFDHYDRWGRTFNRLQNTVAFRGAGTDNSFWKIENFFNRLIILPKNNLIILKSYAQWTPDALPSVQQFQIGGENSVRGFTEGVLIGDRGYNLGVEYRFPLPGLKYVSKWASDRVQGALFYDIGQVWKDSSNPFYDPKTATLSKATLLQGVGFGFRTQLNRFLQGFVDVGFGLGDRKDIEPERRQPTARVHFGVRSDFLPYDYKMRNQKIRVYRKASPS